MPPGLVLTKGLNRVGRDFLKCLARIGNPMIPGLRRPSSSHYELAAITVTHRFHCIAHQVGQYLLDLDTVRHDQIAPEPNRKPTRCRAL